MQALVYSRYCSSTSLQTVLVFRDEDGARWAMEAFEQCMEENLEGVERDINPRSKRPPKRGAVVVTGASSGIGEACTLALVGEVYTVFGGVRKIEQGEALERKGKKGTIPTLLDVTARSSIERAHVRVVPRARSGGSGLHLISDDPSVRRLWCGLGTGPGATRGRDRGLLAWLIPPQEEQDARSHPSPDGGTAQPDQQRSDRGP